jgi:NAD(P)-dependent dehydrogenase (short-subunit alcohol dehydrogenase family)
VQQQRYHETYLTIVLHGILPISRGERAQQAWKSLKENVAESAEEVDGPPTEPQLVDCDLLSFESVRQACQQVKQLTQETGGIDVLCNNAGIMLQPSEASHDGYDITASTNMLSHFLITRELWKSLELAAATNGYARVVTMSSASGYGGPPLDPRFFEPRDGNGNPLVGSNSPQASYERYHQTKLANLAFTAALHDRLQQSPRTNLSSIQAVACTPGVCGTDMFVHATTVMNGGTPSPRSQVPSTEDGAMAQLKCIFDPTVQSGELWGPGPKGSLQCTPMKPPQILVDETSKKQVWEACERAVGEFSL